MVKASEMLKKKLVKIKKEKKITSGLSSGSTLLNCACTDSPNFCFVDGTVHHLVGDSDTGKTILALGILQEAAINPKYDDCTLLFYNAEKSHVKNLFKFYPGLKERLIIIEPDMLEEFYYDLDDRLKAGRVVAIEDSMDALIPKGEKKKFEENKKAHKAGKEGKGDFGSKAKVNNQNLRSICSRTAKNKSIIIIISQTHDNLNAGPFGGDKQTVSGGRGLKFYNRWQVWLKHRKQLTKSYKGKDIQVGNRTQCSIKKNHITGKRRKVEIQIYNDYGIDDIGDCIDFLLEWKHWSKGKGIKAPEFGFVGSRDLLIAKIEKKRSRIKKLRGLVGEVWSKIEKAIRTKRKPKYDAH